MEEIEGIYRIVDSGGTVAVLLLVVLYFGYQNYILNKRIEDLTERYHNLGMQTVSTLSSLDTTIENSTRDTDAMYRILVDVQKDVVKLT